jgi:hypothetical protein
MDHQAFVTNLEHRRSTACTVVARRAEPNEVPQSSSDACLGIGEGYLLRADATRPATNRRLLIDQRHPVLRPRLSGTWTLMAEGYVLPMTLHQDGTRLTGTLQVTHGPFAIVGECKRGRIHFAGTLTEEGFGTTMTRTRSMSRQLAACNPMDRSLIR